MSILKRGFGQKPDHGSAQFGVRNSISTQAVEKAADPIIDSEWLVVVSGNLNSAE